MKWEKGDPVFVPFKIVVETEEEKNVLTELERITEDRETRKIAKNIGTTFQVVDDILLSFRDIIRNQ